MAIEQVDQVPVWVEYLALAVAAVGVGATAWAAISAGRAARSAADAAEATSGLTKVERERWEAEQEARQHANLVVSSEVGPPQDRTTREMTVWVDVHNLGPAVARDVGMTALHEGAGIDFSREGVGVIHPGGTMRFGVGGIGRRVGVVVDVTVTWCDQAGQHSDLFQVTCTNV